MPSSLVNFNSGKDLIVWKVKTEARTLVWVIQTFVCLLFIQVNNIFHDDTIGQKKLTIVPVKLVLLKKDVSCVVLVILLVFFTVRLRTMQVFLKVLHSAAASNYVFGRKWYKDWMILNDYSVTLSLSVRLRFLFSFSFNYLSLGFPNATARNLGVWLTAMVVNRSKHLWIDVINIHFFVLLL